MMEECSICLNQYTQIHRRPIVGKCGHTLCFECVNRVNQISYDRRCTTCRQEFAFVNAPTNFGLLRLLEKHGELGTEPEAPAAPPLPQREENNNEENVENGEEVNDWLNPGNNERRTIAQRRRDYHERLRRLDLSPDRDIFDGFVDGPPVYNRGYADILQTERLREEEEDRVYRARELRLPNRRNAQQREDVDRVYREIVDLARLGHLAMGSN